MIDLLLWIGTIFGILGAVFVAIKKPGMGQLFWVVGNPSLIIANVIENRWSQVFLFGVYMIITIIGLYNYYIKK